MSAALRRHGTTLALVALTAVAGVVLLVVDRGAVTTSETVARKKNLLPVFRRDDITELRITSGDHSARVYRGTLDDAGQRPWQIETDGTRAPAEEAAVDQLLGSLRDGTVDRRYRTASIDAAERKAFGLDAPRHTIEVSMGAQHYRVLLGGPAPTPPGAIYAEVEGQGVSVITPQLAAALGVTPDGLRRRALVTGEADALDALALEGAGGPRRMVRAPWQVSRGLGLRFDGSTPEGSVRVSAAALDHVWDALGQLKADAFLDAASLRDAGTAEPHVTVTLSPHGAPKVVIDVGGECPGHPDDVTAVRREEGSAPLAACVPRGALDELSLPAADLVDKHLVGARADEVIDVTLQQGSTTLALARSGAKWHQQSPSDRPIDPDVGRSFLERLLDVQATDLVPAPADLAALGLDPPRATVRVASVLGEGKEPRTERLEVGTPLAGVVHVRRVEDGMVATVSEAAAETLLPDEMALRSKKAVDLPASEIRSLRIVGPLGTQRFERRPEGTWALLEPQGEGLSPDAGQVSEILEKVAGLTVDRWVGAARPEYGLDRPRLTITAEAGSGKDARTVEIALGAPAGSGAFARLRGDAMVFVAPHALEAAAEQWMIERTALLVDTARMTRVTLAATGGKKVVLEMHEGALQVVGAPAGAAEETRAAAVRDALGDLMAEGAVSVGPPESAQGFAKPSLSVSVELGSKRLELRFGGEGVLRGTRVVYARREGVAATFAVAESRVKPLLDAAR